MNYGRVTTLDNVGVTIDGSGDQVQGGAYSNYVINGNNDQVTEGIGSFATLNGSSDAGTATGSASFNISGYNDTATAADGSYVGVLGSSSGIVIYDNNGRIVTEDNVGVTIDGSGDQVQGGAYSNYVINGNNDQVTEGIGSFATLNGSSDAGTATGSASFNISGYNDTATAADGSYVGVLGSSSGIVIYDNNGRIVTEDNVGVTIDGSGDRVDGGAYSNLAVSGNGDQVNAKQDTSGWISGSGDTLNENGVGDGFNIQNAGGAGDVIDFNASNGYAGLLGGSGYVVKGSNSTIATWDNTSFDANGSNNGIYVSPGSTAAIIGSGNTITAGPDSAVIVAGTGGGYDAISTSNNGASTLTAAGQAAGVTILDGSSAIVGGDNDTVLVGDNAYVGEIGNGNATIVGTNTTANINGDYNQYAAVSGGTVTFTGVNNVAAVTDTTVNSGDGNPVALTGAAPTAGNVQSSTIQDALDVLATELFGAEGTVSASQIADATAASLPDAPVFEADESDDGGFNDTYDWETYSGGYDVLGVDGPVGLNIGAQEGHISQGMLTSDTYNAVNKAIDLANALPGAISNVDTGRVSPVDTLTLLGGFFGNMNVAFSTGTAAVLLSQWNQISLYLNANGGTSSILLQFPGGGKHFLDSAQLFNYLTRSASSLYRGSVTGDLTTVFQSLLGRPPSAAEVANYGKILDNTGSDAPVKASLSSSPEAFAALSTTFTNVFGFAAPSDYIGAVQTGYLEQGQSLTSAAAYWAGLPLTASLVQAASQGIAGDTLDAPGIAAEQSALAGGQTMQAYRTQLADSTDGVNQIVLTAQNIFGVTPDTVYIQAIQNWEIAGGNTQVEEQALAGSPLSQQNIEDAYQDTTGLSIDQSDFTSAEAVLEQGGNIANVGGIIAASDDFQNGLAITFEEILGRDPTSGESSGSVLSISNYLSGTANISWQTLGGLINQGALTFFQTINPIATAEAAAAHTDAQTQSLNRTTAYTALTQPNVKAFLQVISEAEGGRTYNTLYGPNNTFKSYNHYPAGATAAGAYQITPDTYNLLAPQLGITDFTPDSQDLMAAFQLVNTGIAYDLATGNLADAITTAAKTWSAIPLGSGANNHSYYKYTYGPRMGTYQPSMQFDTLINEYHRLGGN